MRYLYAYCVQQIIFYFQYSDVSVNYVLYGMAIWHIYFRFIFFVSWLYERERDRKTIVKEATRLYGYKSIKYKITKDILSFA